MTKARGFWVALLGIALLGCLASGQEGPRQRPREVRPRRPGPEQALRQLYERLVRELELTAEQQPRVKQAIDTHLQDLENWNKENGPKLQELREQMTAARRDGQREKVNELRQEMAKLSQQRGQMEENMRRQILEVLTDEQKQKYQQMARQARLAVVARRGPIVLTAQQTQQVARILKAAAEKAAQADSPQAKDAVWRKAVDDVVAFINRRRPGAPADRPAPRERRGPMAELDLTEAQQQQVQKIMAEAREKAQDGGAEGRRTAFREAMQKIETEVLTPQQVEKLKKLREERRRARPDRPAERRPREGQPPRDE